MQHLTDMVATEAAIKAKAVDWKEAVVEPITSLQANSMNSCSERYIMQSTSFDSLFMQGLAQS